MYVIVVSVCRVNEKRIILSPSRRSQVSVQGLGGDASQQHLTTKGTPADYKSKVKILRKGGVLVS